MGKYKGFFWPALIGMKHMPKIRDSAYYDDAGGYRRAALDDKLAFFIQHPVWEGHPEYFMKNGSPKELYAISGMTIENMLRLAGMGQQAMNVTEGFNYLVEQRARGNVHFISGLYPESERKKDPEKEKTRGLLYQGKAGKPLAVVIAGGGFAGVASYVEAIPIAMELHRRGYSAFVLVYRVNKELHQTEHQAKGEEAARDVIPAVRWLIDHQKEYGYTMDGFSMFGCSAGGLMTTAYAFSDYNDCCHRYRLPRPAAIFPIYGLHWEIRVHDEDKGLAVFSRVGRDDPTGFAAVEDKIPYLKEELGEENVDIIMYDKLGHGFGLGDGTAAEGWLPEAVAFWEKHR